MTHVPLRRNRDFVLLQTGQLLSNLGTASTSIAYPLLVLGLTGSPVKAGVVAFARGVPLAVLSIPWGVAADRFDRRRLMVIADVVRLVAIGALAAWLLLGDVPYAFIPAVAAIEGAAAALFSAAEVGAMRAVVPVSQLPAAAATHTGRQAAIQVGGPTIGGALFAVARAAPFLFDVASYGVSMIALLMIRVRFQGVRERVTATLRTRLAEGFRFMWAHPFMRTTALLFGLGNFVLPGLILAVVVIGRRQGLAPARIGLLSAAFGACLLLGSFLSGAIRRRLSPRAVISLELWTATAIVAFLVWPSVYVLVAGTLATALVIPATNSIVHGYRIAMTPDVLLGRSESIRTTISLAIAPLGPLVAGALLDTTSPRVTIAVFTVAALLLAVWGTVSRPIREAPSLAELEAMAVEPPVGE